MQKGIVYLTHIKAVVNGVVSCEGSGSARGALGRCVKLVEGDARLAEGLEAVGDDDSVVVHPGHVGVS